MMRETCSAPFSSFKMALPKNIPGTFPESMVLRTRSVTRRAEASAVMSRYACREAEPRRVVHQDRGARACDTNVLHGTYLIDTCFLHHSAMLPKYVHDLGIGAATFSATRLTNEPRDYCDEREDKVVHTWSDRFWYGT